MKVGDLVWATIYIGSWEEKEVLALIIDCNDKNHPLDATVQLACGGQRKIKVSKLQKINKTDIF